MATTILLADTARIVREAVRFLLEQNPEFKVVGQVEDGLAAVRMTAELSPSVIIMDVDLAHLNGIEATRQIVAAGSRSHVLGLSSRSEESMVVEMLKAGAAGYVFKTASQKELFDAVQAVALGHSYLSPLVKDIVLSELQAGSGMARSPLFSKLTPREIEVLQLLVEGKSTRESAGLLNISPKTVETHRSSLMSKLDIHSVAMLTRLAIREGLTPRDL